MLEIAKKVKRRLINHKVNNSAESIFGMVTTKILIPISIPHLIIYYKKKKNNNDEILSYRLYLFFWAGFLLILQG